MKDLLHDYLQKLIEIEPLCLIAANKVGKDFDYLGAAEKKIVLFGEIEQQTRDFMALFFDLADDEELFLDVFVVYRWKGIPADTEQKYKLIEQLSVRCVLEEKIKRQKLPNKIDFEFTINLDKTGTLETISENYSPKCETKLSPKTKKLLYEKFLASGPQILSAPGNN